MAADCMRVRLHLRLIRVVAVLTGQVRRAGGVGCVDAVVVALPALWVPLPGRARHPYPQDPGPAGVGSAGDVGVAAPPVRVWELRAAAPRVP